MCVGKVEGGREWHGCVSADAGRSMELQMLDKAQIPKMNGFYYSSYMLCLGSLISIIWITKKKSLHGSNPPDT